MTYPLAHLPSYPDEHGWSKDQIELFQDSQGRLIVPPNLFDVHIKCKIGKLTKVITNPTDGTKVNALTAEGEKWTEEAFPAYAFLDRNQRDELGKPCTKRTKTSENKLAFALHIQNMFGTGGHKNSSSPFINHLHGALRDEMIRRCEEKGKRLPNGSKPCNINDVLSIFKSDDMINMYKSGKKDDVYNLMLHLVKSLTCEDSIGWVEIAVHQYLQQQGMHAVLAPGRSTVTRRNSLVKIAVKKGTQSTKESLKDIELKSFGATLVLSEQVKMNTQAYQDRITSGQWEVVYLDKALVPKSRKRSPAYWVKKEVVGDSCKFRASLTNSVGAGIEMGLNQDEMIEELTNVYAKLTSAASDGYASEDTSSNRNDNSTGDDVDLQTAQESRQDLRDRINSFMVSVAQNECLIWESVLTYNAHSGRIDKLIRIRRYTIKSSCTSPFASS